MRPWLIPISLLAGALGLAAAPRLTAQEGSLRIVERSDWSYWQNGVYAGHAWREARATLSEADADGRHRGNWFLLGESLHDLRVEAKALDESGSLSLGLGPFGSIEDDGSSPVPSFRGLLDLSRAVGLGAPDSSSSSSRSSGTEGPRGSADALSGLPGVGRVFAAPGLRIVRLRDSWHRLAFLAEYSVTGSGSYAKRPVLVVKAKFATRLAQKDGDLVGAAGGHELSISLDAETGMPLFIRDAFDDSYRYDDGGTERRVGTNLIFFSGGDGVGRERLLASLGAALGASPAVTAPPGSAPTGTEGGAPPLGEAPGAGRGAEVGTGPAKEVDTGLVAAGPGSVEGDGELPAAPSPELLVGAGAAEGLVVEKGQAGLTLRIDDLRFAADSPRLLPAESARLDLVAKALLSAPPDRDFLVEGHAAGTGRPQGELELSAQRAKAVVDALVARGIPARRFIWRGLGSTRPVAGNDSEAGRAKNRRVEITILD